MNADNELFPSVDPEEGRVLGFGATSTVYLLEDGTVCKLFNREFSRREILRENQVSETAYRLGLRVPRPYGVVASGDRLGIRRDYLDAESLSKHLAAHPEDYKALLPSYVGELRHFHETEARAEDLASAAELYLEKLDRLSGTDWYTPEELLKMERLIRSVPPRNTLIYGDYHPKNIRVKDHELWFADLGDTCLGHPVFDFAMIANTHFIIPSVNPSYAEKYFSAPAPLMLRLWEDLFSLYFSEYSGEEKNRIRKQIMAFAVLRQGLSPADGRVFPENVLRGNVSAVKKKLMPGIDELIGSVNW